MLGKTAITIEIDTAALSGYTDEHLAALWHIAQANPAPHGDRDAGELAGTIGFEIIRRWLAQAPPVLYRHQARDYYWNELRQLGKWNADREFVPGGQLVDGKVVAPDKAPVARERLRDGREDRPRTGPYLAYAPNPEDDDHA